VLEQEAELKEGGKKGNIKQCNILALPFPDKYPLLRIPLSLPGFTLLPPYLSMCSPS
jgi:hypothetical protein